MEDVQKRLGFHARWAILKFQISKSGAKFALLGFQTKIICPGSLYTICFKCHTTKTN